MEDILQRVQEKIRELEQELSLWRTVRDFLLSQQQPAQAQPAEPAEEPEKEEKKEEGGTAKEEKGAKEEPQIKKYANIVVEKDTVKIQMKDRVAVDDTFKRFIEGRVFKRFKDEGVAKSIDYTEEDGKLISIVARGVKDPENFISELSRPLVWWLKRRK